jgi:basic membrane protein A
MEEKKMKLFKRLLSLTKAAALVFSMTACSTQKPATDTKQPAKTEEKKPEGYELALITDVGTIDDKSFNQGAWEGVEAYAKEKNKTYKYYKPTEKSDTAYINSIDLAIKGGAKVVVCPGFLFEVPIYTVQTKYPDVKFVILDGAPHKGDYKYDIAKNTYSIFYAEQQAGFLAGYSIVKDGYTKLGFMGGMAVPAVVRYGYGFVQGADYAAKELGLTEKVQIKYTYVGNFDASPENQAKASAWYNEGTQVIFACGGAVGNSVMKAAETAKAKVIGVDVDQSAESATVITSSMKNLSKSVYDALTAYYADKFPGGTTVSLDVAVKGVELPMKSSKFAKFTQAEYDAIYQKLVNKDVKVLNDADVAALAAKAGVAADAVTAANVPAEKVTVEVIK